MGKEFTGWYFRDLARIVRVPVSQTGSLVTTLGPYWPHGVLLTTLGLFFVSLKMDDSIYVVQSGKLCVSVVEKVSD